MTHKIPDQDLKKLQLEMKIMSLVERDSDARPVGLSARLWNNLDSSAQAIVTAIANSARRRQPVRIYYRPKVQTFPGGPKQGERERVYRTVYPYSLRVRNIHTQGYDADPVPTVVFFGYDPFKDTIKMFVTDYIRTVEPARGRYVAEWPVEFESVIREHGGAFIDGVPDEIKYEITCGDPGYGPCARCGNTDELRFGCCFDCMIAEPEDLEEITTGAGVAGYEMPLGAQPYWKKKKKKKKKKRKKGIAGVVDSLMKKGK